MGALRGQRIVPQSYTWDHNIDVALEAALRYKSKQYGLFHKYPYSTQCTPIDNTMGKHPMLSRWCSNGARGMPRGSWCECNLTHVNYLKEGEDVENWLGRGLDADPTNPRLFRVPSAFLQSCVGQQTAEVYANQAPSGSVCRCKHTDGLEHPSDVCYISNAALSISRYFVYLDAHAKRLP